MTVHLIGFPQYNFTSSLAELVMFHIFSGNLKRAVELFDKAIPLAKTELEMSHLFSLRDAAVAQATVAEKMGNLITGAGLP